MSVTEREQRRRRSGLGAEELNGEMRRMGEKEKEREREGDVLGGPERE